MSNDPIPQFDESRIQNHPDEVLKSRIRTYFKAFVTGDFDAIDALESEDYTMTDIRTTPSPSYFS
jgi:ketosteroid isomerase-like protein